MFTNNYIHVIHNFFIFSLRRNRVHIENEKRSGFSEKRNKAAKWSFLWQFEAVEIMDANLQKIARFVVLIIENRSFDHLLGYLNTVNPTIAGLTGSEYSNYPDPLTKQQPPISVFPAAIAGVRVDWPNEFRDAGSDPTRTYTGSACIDEWISLPK